MSKRLHLRNLSHTEANEIIRDLKQIKRDVVRLQFAEIETSQQKYEHKLNLLTLRQQIDSLLNQVDERRPDHTDDRRPVFTNEDAVVAAFGTLRPVSM